LPRAIAAISWRAWVEVVAGRARRHQLASAGAAVAIAPVAVVALLGCSSQAETLDDTVPAHRRREPIDQGQAVAAKQTGDAIHRRLEKAVLDTVQRGRARAGCIGKTEFAGGHSYALFGDEASRARLGFGVLGADLGFVQAIDANGPPKVLVLALGEYLARSPRVFVTGFQKPVAAARNRIISLGVALRRVQFIGECQALAPKKPRDSIYRGLPETLLDTREVGCAGAKRVGKAEILGTHE